MGGRKGGKKEGSERGREKYEADKSRRGGAYIQELSAKVDRKSRRKQK